MRCPHCSDTTIRLTTRPQGMAHDAWFLDRSVRQDRDQANCCTIVADHKRISQRHTIPSRVDSSAAYQRNFLLNPHCYLQQIKRNAGRLLSQPHSQIYQSSSLRRCWQIILNPPSRFLLSTLAPSATVATIPTSMKGPSTRAQPQRPSPETMRLSQQAHDQRAAVCRPGTAPDADPTTKMSSTVLHIFSHHQRPKRSIRELQNCQTYRSILLPKSKTRS